jgi:hypothetical protein
MIGWQKKFQINVQKLQLMKFNKSVAAGNFSAFFIKSEWNYSFSSSSSLTLYSKVFRKK